MHLRTRLDKLERAAQPQAWRSVDHLCAAVAAALCVPHPAAVRMRELIETALQRKAVAQGKGRP